MPRKNPFVKVGRPPRAGGRMTVDRAAGMPAGPMDAPGPMASFSPQVPAVAFKRGGLAGFKTMPRHHDDPTMAKRGGKC